jgi:hypothetical protein
VPIWNLRLNIQDNDIDTAEVLNICDYTTNSAHRQLLMGVIKYTINSRINGIMHDKPTHTIRILPAITDRLWRSMWDWLLAPPEETDTNQSSCDDEPKKPEGDYRDAGE